MEGEKKVRGTKEAAEPFALKPATPGAHDGG